MIYENRLCVFNIQHYSLQDGPGIRTTVFLKGCPLRCKWCCNPESQSREPEWMDEKITGQWMTVEEILGEVEKDDVFYRHGKGGMSLSGGEPFLQGKSVVELLKEAKRRYITTAVETCGYVEQEILLEAAPYIDTLFFDIKTLNNEKHKAWTGQENWKIINNIEALFKHYPNLNLHVRTPVIPGFNDQEEDIWEILEFLQGRKNVSYELLPYHYFGKQKYKSLKRPYPMGEARLDEEVFKKLKEIGVAEKKH